MIICTKCLTQNAENAEFCKNPSCGAYLPYWGKPELASSTTTVGGVSTDPGSGESGVKVVVSEETIETSPGAEVSCEARVCNTGTAADEFLLQVFGEPSQWSVIEPARVTLDPGAEVAVTARIRPPASVASQTRRIAFGIGATSTRNTGVFVVKERVLDLVPGTAPAAAVPTPGITMTVLPAEVVCDAGGTATVSVRVRNTGTLIDELVVEVLGAARDWASAEPMRLPLAPGQEATSTVTFHPPRGPEPPAGAVAAGVKVTSGADAAVAAQQPVQVAIRPFTALSLVLRPERAEGSRPTAFELWLLNDGNVPIDGLSIAGSDKEELLGFSPLPNELAVPRGEWGRSMVTVAPRKRMFVGRAKPRTFELAVDGGDQAKRTIGGTLVQKPLLPWWLLAIVAVLAVGIAIIVKTLAEQSDLSSVVVALLAAVGLLVGLVLAGLAMVTGSLGRLFKPGPDPMTVGATFLVGLGGVVAAVVFGLLGAALLGSAGALLAIPAALLAAVLLVGALGRNRPEVPPAAPRPPARP